MRYLALCVAVGLVLVVAGTAGAGTTGTLTTITFNGGDIVADASLTVNVTGTPIIGDGSIGLTSGEIRTYDRGEVAGNPAAFNAWLVSLVAGEGISQFNLWLQDGRSNQATMWGEDIALASTEGITVFAPSGWTALIEPAVWGGDFEGSQIIVYTASGSDYYLRPGNVPVEPFGFTATIMDEFNEGTGPDYQMWVGSADGDVVDIDVGQGLFQRAITATAVAPVPEPLTMASAFFAIGGLGAYMRRRRSVR